MRRSVARVDAWAVRLETIAGVALVVVVEVSVLLQVAMRYLFASPNPWTEELSRFAFIWLSFIGAALATRNGIHFALDSVVAWLSPGTRARVASAVTATVSVLLLVLLGLGAALAHEARLERSPALDVPMIWVYAALPVSSALMLLHLAARAAIVEEGKSEWVSR